MTTVARPVSYESAHYYAKDGTPVYEVPRSDGSGMRPTTLADARKLGLLPSVTTILSILHKPALEAWKIEQAVLACMTAPMKAPDELVDVLVKRVLQDERQHEQESRKAMDRGTQIHQAIEDHYAGRIVEPELFGWIEPVIMWLEKYAKFKESEKIVVCDGSYAGKTDLIQQSVDDDCFLVWDFKTTKKLPKKAYQEHVLQCSAYANAVHYHHDLNPVLETGNIYISTVIKGEFAVLKHEEEWKETFIEGFAPLIEYWKWANDYYP